MLQLDCAEVEKRDLVALYLAGGLSDTDADAFEAHFMGCERCSAELDDAGAIRSAFGKPVLEPPAEGSLGRASGRDLWTLLAAAAAVAMIGLGLRQMARMPSPETSETPVLRGETADSLDLSVTPGSDGDVLLEWPAHPKAQTYRVDVLRTDGIRVLRSETPDNRIELSSGALPPTPLGVSFLVRIEAFGPLGNLVARSDAIPLP